MDDDSMSMISLHCCDDSSHDRSINDVVLRHQYLTNRQSQHIKAAARRILFQLRVHSRVLLCLRLCPLIPEKLMQKPVNGLYEGVMLCTMTPRSLHGSYLGSRVDARITPQGTRYAKTVVTPRFATSVLNISKQF
jgi:hypothetical protein